MDFPYTYDCIVQRVLSGREVDVETVREFLKKNREKEEILMGQKVKIFPSARKIWKEMIEKAVRDSFSLAEELGVKKPYNKVASMYGLSYERVRQIVKKEKKEQISLF